MLKFMFKHNPSVFDGVFMSGTLGLIVTGYYTVALFAFTIGCVVSVLGWCEYCDL